MNHVAETIAGQLHNMKPDHLVPGVDVGMKPVEGGIEVMILRPERKIARVIYDEGLDLYDVTVTREGEAPQEFSGVYCDQLGEIVWGDDAKEFSLPMVQILGDDGEWQVIA